MIDNYTKFNDIDLFKLFIKGTHVDVQVTFIYRKIFWNMSTTSVERKSNLNYLCYLKNFQALN